MTRRKAAPAAMDPIETDFMEALQRLRDGTPRNRELKAAKAVGKLKITLSSVAKEAGRSRTLIALEDCRYPRVREAVRMTDGDRSGEPRTSAELIDKLRDDLADLRVQLKEAKALVGAHFHAREKAERDAERWKAAHDRLLKKRPPADDNVVPFGSRG